MAQHSRGAISPTFRFGCAIAAAVLLSSALLVGIHSGANAQLPNGHCDVNLNGQIMITDALLVAQHVVGLSELAGDSMAQADCNGDGSLTISDALLIAQQVFGLDFPLPFGGVND